MDFIHRLEKKQRLIPFLIFIIAFTFRFYKLSDFPVSLSMDEVSIGYNAYSILKTGKDEWGTRLPLSFRSVGDFKPPVNIYLTLPSVALFGLNEFAVRFPMALIGSLTSLAVVLLIKELKFGNLESYLAGFWLAISPWHTHFSRGGFEAVTALFFLIIGIALFLKSVRTKSYLYFAIGISTLMFAVWSYHAERAFVPLLLIFLFTFLLKRLKFIFSKPKKLIICILFFLMLLLPFLFLTFGTEAVRTRALSTSIIREKSLMQILHYGKYENTAQKVFDNDIYLIFRHFFGKYLNYFDLRFWFWKGMQFTPNNYLDIGLFYALDIFIILPGIYVLFTNKNIFLKRLSIFWFFAGPIPAALTMNEQHPLRALTWLPFFTLAVAAGVGFWKKRLLKRKFIVVVFSISLLINIIYFGDIYFRQFPRFFADAWQYGYKEIALYACENQYKYETVNVTDTFGSVTPTNTGIPAEYILFYCKIDPEKHFTQNAGFEKIKIRRIQWKSETTIPRESLIVGSALDLPLDLMPKEKIIKVINYPSGKPAFVFVDTRESI